MKTARDPFFDLLRGLGILLVILGHQLQALDPQYDDNIVFRTIYMFHMPLFFFISGCVFSFGESRLEEVSHDLWKKFRALVIPFLAWGLIFHPIAYGTRGLSYPDFAALLIRTPDNGLWFLWALFLCFLFFIPLKAGISTTARKWEFGWFIASVAVFLVFYFIPTPNFGVNDVEIHYLYFVGGFWLTRWRQHFTSFEPWLPEISLVGLLLVCPITRRTGDLIFQPFLRENLPPLGEKMFVYLFQMIAAFIGIGALTVIARQIKNLSPSRWIAWLGRYTMDIYVIHLVLLGPVVSFFVGRTDLWVLLGGLIWAVAASLAVSFYLLRPSRLLRFLFLGL